MLNPEIRNKVLDSMVLEKFQEATIWRAYLVAGTLGLIFFLRIIGFSGSMGFANFLIALLYFVAGYVLITAIWILVWAFFICLEYIETKNTDLFLNVLKPVPHYVYGVYFFISLLYFVL